MFVFSKKRDKIWIPQRALVKKIVTGSDKRKTADKRGTWNKSAGSRVLDACTTFEFHIIYFFTFHNLFNKTTTFLLNNIILIKQQLCHYFVQHWSLTNLFNFHTGNVLNSENVHEIDHVHKFTKKKFLPAVKTQNIAVTFRGIHLFKTGCSEDVLMTVTCSELCCSYTCGSVH